ncbi:MAG: ATP-binding protein, partial [Candidatus Dojkabacteria bacterium]|nr:ATP-binding protein [Candidatus Dojkabacteria bacterium]
VYGAPGSGKTTFSGTFPKPIYLNIEAGVNALRGKDIDFIDITSWYETQDTLKRLKSGQLDYESVIIDSVTELMKKRQDEVKGGKQRLSLQDWGVVISDMEQLLRSFRDLDAHVLFVMAEEEERDEERILVRPSLSGRTLPTQVAGYVDIVGYAGVRLVERQPQYIMQFAPSDKIYAKSRFPEIPSFMQDPTFNKIYSLITTDEKS